MDRTAKERHIRLHCMHMPGEMGTDRHSAAHKHLPKSGTILCIGSVFSWPAGWIMQDFCIDSTIMKQSESAAEGFLFTICSRHVGFPLSYDPY